MVANTSNFIDSEIHNIVQYSTHNVMTNNKLKLKNNDSANCSYKVGNQQLFLNKIRTI